MSGNARPRSAVKQQSQHTAASDEAFDTNVQLTEYGSLGSAFAIVKDPDVPIVDKAPVFAILHRLQLEINRVIRPLKAELAMALSTEGIERLGNLKLRWRPQSVEFPVNDPGNWTDETVQEALAALGTDPDTADLVVRIPDHWEVVPKAIAGAMHDGRPAAALLWRQMNKHGWRVEVHPRPEIEVEEVKIEKP